MKRAKLEERRRFAVEIARRDAERAAERLAKLEANRRLGTAVRVRPPRTVRVRLTLQDYWIERYSLDEIRELAAGLLDVFPLPAQAEPTALPAKQKRSAPTTRSIA